MEVLDTVATLEKEAKAYLCIHMSVLDTHVEKGMNLLHRMLSRGDFTNETRFTQIINEGKAFMRSRMMDGGTHLAILKASLPYSAIASLDDIWHGMEQLSYLLSPQNNKNMLNDIALLTKKIYSRNRMHCVVVAHSKYKKTILPLIEKTAQKLQSDKEYVSTRTYSFVRSDTQKQRAFLLPSQTAYNAMVLPTVDYTHKYYVAYDVLSRVVSARLWENIRMRYGAYGTGCSLIGNEGLMEFYTYRDPKIAESFDAFEITLREIAKGIDYQEIQHVCVGKIGESLSPLSPIQKGKIAHRRDICSITDELRQNIRDSIFSLTPDAVSDAAHHCLDIMDRASKTSFCNEDVSHTYQWDTIERVPQ